MAMPAVWEIMTRHLFFLHVGFGVRIHAFVLMTNHFHLIARAPEGNISEAMSYFLRETSREITKATDRINQTYGGRFHRSLLSSPLYYQHAYKYLYRNPVEAGLSSTVEEYPFSAIPGLLGERWLDVPISEDESWATYKIRTETLSWLNSQPQKDHWKEVRTALRKNEFKLSKKNRKPSDLELNAL